MNQAHPASVAPARVSPFRARILLLALCGMLGMTVAACGKKGSPEAPGPADQITYPRAYPPP